MASKNPRRPNHRGMTCVDERDTTVEQKRGLTTTAHRKDSHDESSCSPFSHVSAALQFGFLLLQHSKFRIAEVTVNASTTYLVFLKFPYRGSTS